MDRAVFVVGVAVIVWRGDHILVGKRVGAQGAGTWAAPGGCLEAGESIEHCAARELREETGLLAERFTVIDAFPWTDRPGGITVIVEAHGVFGEAETREPDKCEGWHWHTIKSIPQPRYPELSTWLKRKPA